MSAWKVILATMVIFACGAITGGLLVRNTAPHTSSVATNFANVTATNFVSRTNVVWAPIQQQRMSVLRQMANRLRLTPEQHERINLIIKESQERNKALWEQIAPDMRAELKRVTDEIRKTLDPQQQRHFQELLRENRRENHLKPPLNGATNLPPPAERPN